MRRGQRGGARRERGAAATGGRRAATGRRPAPPDAGGRNGRTCVKVLTLLGKAAYNSCFSATRPDVHRPVRLPPGGGRSGGRQKGGRLGMAVRGVGQGGFRERSVPEGRRGSPGCWVGLVSLLERNGGHVEPGGRVAPAATRNAVPVRLVLRSPRVRGRAAAALPARPRLRRPRAHGPRGGGLPRAAGPAQRADARAQWNGTASSSCRTSAATGRR